MRWRNTKDFPKEKGWYLLKAPKSSPSSAGRSFFNGCEWEYSDVAKNYLYDQLDLMWLDESPSPSEGEAISSYEKEYFDKKSVKEIVEENFKGLDDLVNDKYFSRHYKLLIVTCMEIYGKYCRQSPQPLPERVEEAADEEQLMKDLDDKRLIYVISDEQIEMVVAKIFYSYPSDETEEESIKIGVDEVKKLIAASQEEKSLR